MNNKMLSNLSILALMVAMLTGCSFSKSSESSSDSSKSLFDLTSSPLTSSSDSSVSEQEKFENDVADYTKEFATASTGTMDQFREHLSKIAEDHGITDWENDLTTYKGIGRGLKKAKLNEAILSDFIETLSSNDTAKKQAIEDGLK